MNAKTKITQFFFDTSLGNGVFKKGERISLDIGSHAVKTVQFRAGPKGISLVKAGYQEISPAAGQQGAADEESLLSDAINTLWQEQKMKSRRVQVVISDPAVYSRHISIPRVSEDELFKAIRWQAEKYTPFPIDDDVAVDYQILASGGKDQQNQMDLVIVAAQGKTINKYLSILKRAKITPVLIDVSPFAMIKALWQNTVIDEKEMVPVIDIGARTTSISIIKKESLLLVRNIELAGSHFTKAIADGLNMKMPEAEQLKVTSSLFPSGQDGQDGQGQALNIFSVLEPLLSEWVSQINRSFAYCEKEWLVEKIQRVILCGGGARFKGLDQFLSGRLGLPVEAANPFEKTIVDNRLFDAAFIQEISPKLMAAAGEAL